MIGRNYVNDKTNLYLIHWKNDYSEQSINRLSFHIPRDRFMSSHFEISHDGKWLKGVSFSQDTDIHDDKIVFYQADVKYPAGLSLGVLGGESNINMWYYGAFVETKQWGQVYIDIHKASEGILLVYKMRDVMEQIVKRAKEMVE
jgi:hypothetical protein